MMNSYLALEWIVIASLLGFSLRTVWLRVLKPLWLKPKAACGSACTGCQPSASKPQ